MAARSKAGPNTEIVGSNPTWGMYISVHLFYVCGVLRVGSGLAMG
jgi:hypothetical protein